MSSVLASKQNELSVSPPAKRARIVEVSNQKKESKTEEMSGAKMDTSDSSGSRQRAEAANGSSSGLDGVDTNLYSRQIYTLGESAMMHLRSSSVLISGIGGVGVEVAKNLILGGVRHVTLHDVKNATWRDLAAQYYLTEEDIGKNRAAVSFAKLSELNDSVTCVLNTEPISEDLVKAFDLTVLTDTSLDVQLQVSQWIRAHGKRMLVTDSRGLFSFIFTDFGEQFRVDDKDCEQPKEFHIEHIDRETGDVTTMEDIMHGLADGDHVTFSEVKGMTQINGCDPIKISVKKPNLFNIGDAAANFDPHTEGGRAREVKVSTYVDFKPLAEALKDPEFLMWDFAKFDYPAQLHALFQALYAFEKKHDRTPAPRSDDDAALLKAELPSGAEVDEKLLKHFSYQASGLLVNVCSVVGGIAAQEAMKGVTHHMTPLTQFLYIDHLDALPGDWNSFDNAKLTPEDCAPRNQRYDAQAAVFGWPYQEALGQQKWFVVGAGAIGCELLKNLSMMGVAAGPNGLIKVTDMDQIEISNLNRQFLFRRPDVGEKKSVVAARAVKAFNPNFNVEAMAERVGPDTESIFTDEFFQSLNGVLNALDNLDARRYMDRRCLFYGLPLLESGTLGSKGNIQVIYPFLTESYSSSQDPPEKDIPICTLKNFPNEIQHTIQWARDHFETLFSQPSENANRFIKDSREFLKHIDTLAHNQKIEMLAAVINALDSERPVSAEECVVWARLLFQKNFYDNIAQMLHMFPSDMVTDHGAKFWSGTKRCPHPITFDANNEEHVDFVYSASILHAEQYNLKPILDRETVAKIAAEVSPPPFVPKQGLKIAVTEAEAKEMSENSGGDANEEEELAMKIKLARITPNKLIELQPIDFEKDDDTNHHMEFITSCSNLRATNYDIQPADRMKTKQIAGRIIPAIATTTAAVAGLVCVELFKMIDANGTLPRTPLERFKNGFMNIALPFFGFSEPIAAPKKKFGETEWTIWDSLEIQAPKTMKELIEWLQNEIVPGSNVTMLSSGVSLIYSFFMSAASRDKRMNMDVADVVAEVSKKQIPSFARSIVLEVMLENTDEEEIEVPYIKYILPSH